MTPTQLIAYYVALLILQYNTKPKAQATIAALVDAEIANLVITQVADAFTVSTAVGVQLDTLAKYVGASRTIYGLNTSKTYFQFRYAADPPPPGEIQNGFATVASPNTPWFWIQPSDIDFPIEILNDGLLRQLIEYLAAAESLDQTVEAIDQLFLEFFGQYVTWTDNMDMTMTVTHDQTHDPSTLFQIVNYIRALPRPAGVALSVVTI